jgi:hypothetical protein
MPLAQAKKAATEAAAMLSALYCSAELAEICVSQAKSLFCRAQSGPKSLSSAPNFRPFLKSPGTIVKSHRKITHSLQAFHRLENSARRR